MGPLVLQWLVGFEPNQKFYKNEVLHARGKTIYGKAHYGGNLTEVTHILFDNNTYCNITMSGCRTSLKSSFKLILELLCKFQIYRMVC